MKPGTFFAGLAFLANANAEVDGHVDPKRDLLNLGGDIAATAQVGNLLNLNVNLPLGLNLPSDVGPYGSPPEGCSDLYHPPHIGIIIDECDNDSENGWHWVHDCGCSSWHTETYSWTTSTVTATSWQTVISCAPTVTNCPAQSAYITTVTVPETTTICPVLASQSATATAYVTSTWAASTWAASTWTASTWAASTTTCIETPVWTTSYQPAPPATTYKVETATYVAPLPPVTTAPVTPCTTIPVTPVTPVSPVTPCTTAVYTPPCPVGTGNSTMSWPPHMPTGGYPVTAGAAQNAGRAGLAVAAGLVVALL